MKIYFISPIGKKSYSLFDTFIPTFESRGYEIVNDVKDADIVFVDLYDRKHDYDEKELLDASDKQRIIFDFWDYGGCIDGTEIFPYWNDECNIFNYFMDFSLGGDIWFVRKMDKTIKYSQKVYPIECIIYPDHDFKPTTKEELFNRQYDICFIGNSSPTRKNVVKGLIEAGFKIDIHWTNEKGKLPHDEWLERHRQAKMFLTADGGGFSDERTYQLYAISAMLKQRSNQYQLHPSIGIYINEHPTGRDISIIRAAISNHNLLYSTYMANIEHMKKYYTAEYRANYILDIIGKSFK